MKRLVIVMAALLLGAWTCSSAEAGFGHGKTHYPKPPKQHFKATKTQHLGSKLLHH